MSDVRADWVDRLRSAAQDAAERGRLNARVARLEQELAVLEEAASEARRTHSLESEDVARLESFSTTRIWSSLRGNRDIDLNRERAERQAAEYAVARAEAAADDVRQQLDRTMADRNALGDPEERHAKVHAEAETWLAGRPDTAGEQLASLITRAAELTAVRREVDEALVRARHATDALHRALDKLGSAESWATYDTFFGGGIITDAIKYDRVDEAERLMRTADDAMRALSRELADVGMTGVGGVEITELARAFDVWFDNVFSDWSVRDRIGRAAARLRDAVRAVQDVRVRLEERRRVVVDELGQVEQDRALTVKSFLASGP